MTKIVSIVLAFSLLVNDFNILCSGNVLKDQDFASNLVFLVSVCLLMRRINVFPKAFWRKFSPICILLEIFATVVLLECSLLYVWKHVQDYVLGHADALLVILVEQFKLDWLVCHLCCGKSNCPAIFAALVLKALSFVFLLAVCTVIK